MAGLSKNLREPEEVISFPSARYEIVDLGDHTVAYGRLEPGWRWSTHVRPEVGGQWCQAHHVGVILKGRMGIVFVDGSTMEVGPLECYDIPPGHDGYVIGHEPVESIEWSGARAWGGFRSGTSGRMLVTLLITDLVDSTPTAAKLGDAAWRDLSSRHFSASRDRLDRFGGREVKTTGDGMIATFDATANAIRCADEILRVARGLGVAARAGVHVGEVDFVGNDVRGVAVHEAERIAQIAGADEVFVSETTRVLAMTAGLSFDDRGMHALKGLEGERRIFAYTRGSAPAPT